MAEVSEKLDVTITLHDDSHPDIGAVSQRLSALGLEDAVALANIGVISGAVAPDKVAQLRADPGVKAVEVAGGVQLPPPESEIQ